MRRIVSRRTVISLVLTVGVLAVGIWRAPIDWHEAWTNIRRADIRLYVLGVLAYYGSFILRARRWQLLLRNTGEEIAFLPLLATLLRSFFVNCGVPAKLGDP